MKHLILGLFIFSTQSFSQDAAKNSETTFDNESSEIYQNLGVPEISKDAFTNAYIAFQAMKGEGKISNLPLITFVNFSIPSNRERLYVIDLKSRTVVFRSKVAHGKNSGGVAEPATRFSNVDNSLQSSLGFYLTGETYSGKHGNSLRLDGLSSGLNTNARNRDIVVHAAAYVDGGGRSFGCLALPPQVTSQAIELLKNKTLIYTFTGNQLAKLGDKNSAVIASSNKDYSSVPNVANVQPEFPEFSSMQDLSTAAPSIGTAGASSAGVTLLQGSEKYQQCQNLSNKPWAETVKGISSGANPSSFFTGSWGQLKNQVAENEVENEDAVKLSEQRLSDINDCVAIAHISTNTNFTKDNINTPETKASSDGKIKCVYNSPESQDFNTCVKSILTYEALNIKEKSFYDQQAEDVKNQNKENLANLNSTNAQGQSLALAKGSQDTLSKVSLERADISAAKINALQAIASKIPTNDSLFDECQTQFNKHGLVSKNEFTSFVKMYSSKPVEFKDTTNHCLAAVSANVNPIQNEVARTQIKSVLKDFGKEVTDYESKSEAFKNRNSPLLTTGESSMANFNKNNDGSFINNAVASVENGIFPNGSSFSSSNQNSFAFGSENFKNGGSQNDSVLRFGVDTNNINKKDNQTESTFTGSAGSRFAESSAGQGIFNPAFYEKINIALADPSKLESLKLSPAQMKEYLERKKYNDSLSSNRNSRGIASVEVGGKDDKSPMAIQDKSLNLFEIISKRYQAVFEQK